MTTTLVEARPLAVRVLRGSGWFALVLGLIAFVIGAVEGFNGFAFVWAIIAIELVATALAAFLGTRRSWAGFLWAGVACSLLLFLPPIPIAIALIASQSWPQLSDYYGIRRRVA